MITVKQFNESFLKVYITDYGVEQEFAEYFTFFAKDYKFLPKFKAGLWDGKIRMFNMRSKTLLRGLLDSIRTFAESHNYELTVDSKIVETVDRDIKDTEAFMESMQLHARGKPLVLRDYQIEAVHHAMTHKRSILLAATSSGKSMIIYSALRNHMLNNRRTLLIVPSINLTQQMFSDFEEYSLVNGFSVEENAHKIYGKQAREFTKPIIISTWQTLSSMLKNEPQAFYQMVEEIDVVIGDEAHEFKATETCKIMEAFVNTEWRMGTTGTVDNVQINVLTLVGLFGPLKKIVTARELIDEGNATPIEVRVIVLKHPEVIRKAFKGMKYEEEISHIISNQNRTRFIANLAKACKGTTLIIYKFVERHGDLIYDQLKKIIPEDRSVHYIHGGVDADERERIRKIVETETDAIIVGTDKLVQRGTNIPGIANLILAMSGKSGIPLKQAIGRTMRLKEGKDLSKVFDIADDYNYKSWQCASMRHLDARIAIYTSEEHIMKVIHAPLNY